MSSSHLYFLLSVFTLIWPALSATCEPRAVSVPFKSYSLVTKAEVRGVLWQIGGPSPQNITLMPSAYYIDTYLWSRPFGICPTGKSAAWCATYRGGLYDDTNSETDTRGSNMVAHTFDNTISNWTLDDVKLQDNTTLPKYEFGLRTNSVNSYVHKGELGLARTSSFLKTLGDRKNISSGSYSFFWGNEVSDEPRDGSLTLGGYDQALIADGPNVTVPFTTDEKSCAEGIIVNITSLGIQASGGGVKDVWEGLPDLRVCVIATTSNIMSIPGHYWDPIQAAMGVQLDSTRNGTSKEHFYNTTTVTPASATYSGDLAITINNAATYTIPNNQLIFDEHYIADSGLIQTKKDVKQIPIVRIAAGDGMMPRLGGMFFSSAYLIVNHDKTEFTIAPVQSKLAASKIMAIDTKNNCIGEVEAAVISTTSDSPKDTNVSTGGPSTPGNPNSNGSSNSGSGNSGSNTSSGSSSGTSGGAIAGIVVGVVGGLALFAGIAFLLWRRKRANASPAELAAFNQNAPAEKYGYNASEMYVDNGHVLGTPESNSYRHEMDGTARPYEVAAPEYSPPVPEGTQRN